MNVNYESSQDVKKGVLKWSLIVRPSGALVN